MTQRIDPQSIGELNPPNRLMLTPGPPPWTRGSIGRWPAPRSATWILGLSGCMDDTQVLLRQIFQTENRLTMPLSASGSGGIEASVVNTLEEGDEAIICVNGLFSERMAVIAMRIRRQKSQKWKRLTGRRWIPKMCAGQAKARKSRS